MRIHTIVAAAVAAVVLSLSAPADAATVWTGCKDLATGALSKAKIGTKPSSPCDVVKQIQVTYTKPFTPKKGFIRVTREWNATLTSNEEELRVGPGLAIVCFVEHGIFTIRVILNGRTEYEQISDNGVAHIFSYRRPTGSNSVDLGQGFLVSAEGSAGVPERGGCKSFGTATFMIR